MKNILMIILLVVCIGILVGMFVISNNKPDESNNITNTISNSNIVDENKNTQNTNIEIENEVNEVEENKIENTNVSDENVVSNTTVNNTITETESNESEETTEDYDNSSDKEIAISLAEKEWGEDDTVYYTNEGIRDGKYVVAVRDKSNTSVKLYYKVDIKNNSVEIEW